MLCAPCPPRPAPSGWATRLTPHGLSSDKSLAIKLAMARRGARQRREPPHTVLHPSKSSRPETLQFPACWCFSGHNTKLENEYTAETY